MGFGKWPGNRWREEMKGKEEEGDAKERNKELIIQTVRNKRWRGVMKECLEKHRERR